MDFCPFCGGFVNNAWGPCDICKSVVYPVFKIDESKWPAFKEPAMSILNITRDEWQKMLRKRPTCVVLKCDVYNVAYERDEDGREFAFIQLSMPKGVFVVTEDGRALSDSCFGNLAGIKIFLNNKKSLAGEAAEAASHSTIPCQTTTVGSKAWMNIASDYIKRKACSVEDAVNATIELHAIVEAAKKAK